MTSSTGLHEATAAQAEQAAGQPAAGWLLAAAAAAVAECRRAMRCN